MIAKKIATGPQKFRAKKTSETPWSKEFSDVITRCSTKSAGKTCNQCCFPDISAAKRCSENDDICRNRLNDNISRPAQKKQGRVAKGFDRHFRMKLNLSAIKIEKQENCYRANNHCQGREFGPTGLTEPKWYQIMVLFLQFLQKRTPGKGLKVSDSKIFRLTSHFCLALIAKKNNSHRSGGCYLD